MQKGDKLILSKAFLDRYREVDPNFILRILRAPINVFWSWGGQAFTNLAGKGLRFKSNGFRHKGYVYIFVNGTDLFDVVLTTLRGTVVEEVTDIYFDDLQGVVDSLIEYTGDDYADMVAGLKKVETAVETEYPEEVDPDSQLAEKYL